jgi:hypothetical protein
MRRMGGGGVAPWILNVSIRERCWSAGRSCLFIPRERPADNRCIASWANPTARGDDLERKKSYTYRESKHDSSVVQFVAWLVYWLRHSGVLLTENHFSIWLAYVLREGNLCCGMCLSLSVEREDDSYYYWTKYGSNNSAMCLPKRPPERLFPTCCSKCWYDWRKSYRTGVAIGAAWDWTWLIQIV